MQADECQILSEIRKSGPLATYRRLLAENDAQARGPELTNGRQLAAARTALHTALVRAWAEDQQARHGYDKPFAVVALGGTGRDEMSPRSDNDFAFLFDDALEGNTFLLELQRQVVHSTEFRDRYGFTCLALPFCLDDVPNLNGKQLNSFLDLRAVHDPDELAATFRARIRATYDPFEHFLHLRRFWLEHWEQAAGQCERLDRFDFKNGGLRVFLAGIWTQAGREFVHSHEIYRTVEDRRDLEAYELLLRLRAFVQLRHPGPPQVSAGGQHPEDILEFEGFTAFGEMLGPEASARDQFEFANDVRARLIAARRRVANFSRSIMDRELRQGRVTSPGSPIVYGLGGLRFTQPTTERPGPERSRAALSLLVATQRYGVPVDPAELHGTFQKAGDWLEPVPELSALFYETRGSLAASFAFLAQIDGAEERLFPGHARFEASMDPHVLAERSYLRGALARRKLEALEQLVRDGRARLATAGQETAARDPGRGVTAAVEAALLDADHLAAIRLALKTKRLPLTEGDPKNREDESRPLHERFSSGFSDIPLDRYFLPLQEHGGFPAETVRLAAFLIAHRRQFKERSATGMSDVSQIDELVHLCPDEQCLRMLFVFTCADRVDWESARTDPVRWFNTRELYAKALQRFRPVGDPARLLASAGYTPEERAILRDFGEDFFGGIYRAHAIRFGSHLLRLVGDNVFDSPKAAIVPDVSSTIVGVAARDYRGLAATISGALWRQGIDLRQAHLFSAMNYRLALDFFHVAPREGPLPPGVLRNVEEAIRQRAFIAEADEADLPQIPGHASLHDWRHGLHCLRFETSEAASGLIYLLAYRVFRHLRGDIYGLSAHATRGQAFVSVYHRLPPGLSGGEAHAIVQSRFNRPTPA